MNAGLIIQYVIVALVVLACAVLAIRKLLPNASNRWLASASLRLGRKQHSRVAQTLSRRLQPKKGGGSCADGCATCDACGPGKTAAEAMREREKSARTATGDKRVPLHFMPMSRQDSHRAP